MKSQIKTQENRTFKVPNYSLLEAIEKHSIKENQTFPHAKLKLFLSLTTKHHKNSKSNFLFGFHHPSRQPNRVQAWPNFFKKNLKNPNLGESQSSNPSPGSTKTNQKPPPPQSKP
ncbi:hypothetical protein CIPAW_03G136900 [Carya illinoinensis]|uniref:Uncharacterized protein n=1 Tax=Carya illinoinensis TaxID=32201 RepID=A0A8T1R2Y4_CARIL|nr:hypothetical protein CIPAW_03G136900 [Carya illinoinensis]